MAGWDGILTELSNYKNPLDTVRQQYIQQMFELTKRNVILYHSAFLTKPVRNVDINDSDMSGFMNAVHGLDAALGLDLILHTPGGDPMAAESIVNYLRSKFNKDIRVIVPHMAMSAGTMIACAARVILMGKHSSLGPIDPQFNGIPAYDLMQLFREAKQGMTSGTNETAFWQKVLDDHPYIHMYRAIKAIELSETLAREWLGSCMYDETTDKVTIDQIVASLNENIKSKSHDRHFGADKCRSFGLKVNMLEDDNSLQDAVLSIFHTTTITFSKSNAIKIIESQNGSPYIVSN